VCHHRSDIKIPDRGAGTLLHIIFVEYTFRITSHVVRSGLVLSNLPGTPMSRIYIETTIPSFYYEVRTHPTMVARRLWTREWFDRAVARDVLVTSAAVLEELERGEFPGREDAVRMIENLVPLQISIEVREIVREYIDRQLMPADPSGDALHLAVASFYECEFLVTWNCQHLANANKFDNIARVNGILNLAIPKLVTPLELLGMDVGDE
jgi:predicted nucleic acid-binding protein